MTPVLGRGAVCYCGDCQAFARHLKAADILDDSCGSDIFTTLPDRLRLVQGAEHLRVLRMTPKGPLRRYAGCCDTPRANTGPKRDVSFVSLILNISVARDALGPVACRLHADAACGPVPKGGVRPAFIRGVLRRAAVAQLAGRHRQTPFFDATGAAVAEVQRLSAAERRAARP